MILFIDWNDIERVNQEGCFVNFHAKVQTEAVYKCDSIDAMESMVHRIEASELPDELLDRLENYLAEQRDGVARRLWASDDTYVPTEADYE